MDTMPQMIVSIDVFDLVTAAYSYKASYIENDIVVVVVVVDNGAKSRAPVLGDHMHKCIPLICLAIVIEQHRRCSRAEDNQLLLV